ncbi:hypothetical protein HG531_000638 [Fusarium graminearum]|nr:hypothetical protein HG531_000638 [Fusarium graminearum]
MGLGVPLFRVQNLLALLGVEAADGLADLADGKGDRDTVLVTSRVVDTSAGKDGVRAIGLRAGDEVVTVIVLEEVVLRDGPLVVLAAGAERLSAGTVSHHALAHATSIGPRALTWKRCGVKEHLLGLGVEGESGRVDLVTAVTRGALVLELQGKAVVGSLEVGVMDRTGRSKSNELKDLDLRVGSGGGDASGDERSEDEVLELHDGGCCWWFN